jgi:hypothetical protein
VMQRVTRRGDGRTTAGQGMWVSRLGR